MIKGLGNYSIFNIDYNAFSNSGRVSNGAPAAPAAGSIERTAGAVGSVNENAGGAVVNPAEDGRTPETTVKPGKRSSPAECQTCKERKYVDGSNENDVSFKSPTHISPNSAGAAVRAHENMHVQNAYQKAGKEGGKVLQASVSIHTAVCPECGRVYVSGGTTKTAISSPIDNGGDASNPYKQQAKAINALFNGANVNYRA